MSWKLANAEILDETYFNQLKKYNPDAICIADNLLEGLKKLNNEGIKSKVVFVGSMKSNRGYICFNNKCITEKEAMKRIIDSYKQKHGVIQDAIRDAKLSYIEPFYTNE
jgi:hypothetical protein